METPSLKQTYYKDADSIVEVELAFPIACLHCEVGNWSPRVLRQLYRVFAQLSQELKQNEYTTMITASPNPKFAKLFGGTTINKCTLNNQEYEVIVWELKLL